MRLRLVFPSTQHEAVLNEIPFQRALIEKKGGNGHHSLFKFKRIISVIHPKPGKNLARKCEGR